MSLSREPMRLTDRDLFAPQVDQYIEEQALLRRADLDFEPRPLWKAVLFSSYFYLSISCGFGAFCAWLLLDPFFIDGPNPQGSNALVAFLMFPTVVGLIGFFLGAVEGIMCRNLLRASISAVAGLAIGFVGGAVALIPAGLLFAITKMIVESMQPKVGRHGMPMGFALFVLIVGRALAWSIASIPAGIGQGIAIRESKVLVNGLLGAVLGGFLGGLMFDPIAIAFTTPDGRASISRLIGFVIIGMMVGLFVGVVEQMAKTAWLLMKAGPLAGKQFIIYKNPTVLGSSPKADIYLFKDDAIEPRHALIHDLGGRFQIEDCNSADGTYVNGYPIKTHVLRQGDQIVLGKTVLEFAVKDRG